MSMLSVHRLCVKTKYCIEVTLQQCSKHFRNFSSPHSFTTTTLGCTVLCCAGSVPKSSAKAKCHPYAANPWMAQNLSSKGNLGIFWLLFFSFLCFCCKRLFCCCAVTATSVGVAVEAAKLPTYLSRINLLKITQYCQRLSHGYGQFLVLVLLLPFASSGNRAQEIKINQIGLHPSKCEVWGRGYFFTFQFKVSALNLISIN